MSFTKEKKEEIFAKYSLQKTAKDTGSVESQVALITHRINHLTEHLKQNKKDHSCRRSLLALVGQRKRLLTYLTRVDINRYRALIAQLNLRK